MKPTLRIILLAAFFAGSLAQAECLTIPPTDAKFTAYKNSLEASGKYDDLLCLAKTYYHTGNYTAANTYYSKLLDIAQNDEERGSALIGIGISIKYLDRHEEAITALNKALEIEEKLQRDTERGIILANLASIYGDMGKNDESIAASQKALPLLSSQFDIAATLNNIAMAYREKLDEAESIKYINMAISIDMKYLIGDSLAIHSINKGYILNTFGKYQQAIVSLTDGISLAKTHGILFWEMSGNYTAAVANYKIGNKETALELIRNAISISKKIGMIDHQRLYEDNERILAEELQQSKNPPKLANKLPTQ